MRGKEALVQVVKVTRKQTTPQKTTIGDSQELNFERPSGFALHFKPLHAQLLFDVKVQISTLLLLLLLLVVNLLARSVFEMLLPHPLTSVPSAPSCQMPQVLKLRVQVLVAHSTSRRLEAWDICLQVRGFQYNICENGDGNTFFYCGKDMLKRSGWEILF